MLEGFYSLHVRIRYVHDKTYQKVGWYKRYTDKGYTEAIHKATLAAFIISFVTFTIAQYLFPSLFNFGNGNQAYAAKKNKTWTTNGDFSAATNSNLYISGSGGVGNPDGGNSDSVTLKTTSDFGKCTDATACPDVSFNQGGTQNFYTLQDVANATISANAASGQKNLSLSNVTGSFTVGKKVLVAQMAYVDRASYLALPNGGQEEAEIASVNGSVITLKNNLVNNYYYSAGTSLAQVIEIKEFYNLTITNNTSVGVTAYDATTGKGGILPIKVNNQLSIDAGSQINLTGQGYPRAKGPGGAISTGVGGAYGGAGGYTAGYAGGRTVSYGSNANVSYMGSGGGNGSLGGAGGGLVKIASRSLQLNGKIQSNGKAPTNNTQVAGSGSGGGINITSPTLNFNVSTGLVSAAGGGVATFDGNDGYGGGSSSKGGGPTGAPGDGGIFTFGTNSGTGPSAGNSDAQIAGGAAGRVLMNYTSVNGVTLYSPSAIQETDPAIGYVGSWSAWANGAFSGGSAKKTSAVGDTVSYTYTGKDFYWYGAKTTTSGQARVTIDGASETVDLMAPYGEYQCWDPDALENTTCYGYVDTFNTLVYSKPLSVGTHTVQIENLSATTNGGHDITVDYFTPSLPNASANMYLVASTDRVGPWGFWSFTSAYVNAGSLGESGTPLRFTVPTSKGKWKTIDIAGSIPNGTTALFKIRAGSSYGVDDVNGTNGWKNPIDKSSAGWSATPVWIPAESVYRLTVDQTLGLTATLEVMMQLNGGDATPRIDSISAYYDAIDDPTNLTLTKTNGQSLFKADGTVVTGGASGGFTNETSIRVAANAVACTDCSGTSTNARLQVEVKSISSSFNDSGVIGTDWIEDGGTNDADGQKNNGVTINGLSTSPEYRYKARARGIDNEGRSSNWVSYAVDGSGASFAIDQTDPTISGTFTVKSANNNTYVSNNQRLISLSGLTINDAGNSSPTSTGKIKVQVSQDGKNWGFYSAGSSANVRDNTATNTASYKLITPSASVQADIASAWSVEGGSDGSGDGVKTIFVRAIDNAGNITGTVQSTTAQFTGTVGGGASKANDQLLLTNQVIANEQVNNVGTDTVISSTAYSNSSATRVRVNWTYYLEDSDSSANIYVPANSPTSVVFKAPSTNAPLTVTTETTNWFNGNTVRADIYSYGAMGAYIKINWVEFDTGSGLSNTPPNNQYSAIIDRGAANTTQFTSLNWSQYLPTGTSVDAQVMAGNNADATGGMGLTTVTNGQAFVDLAGWQNYRYVKYVFTLHPDAGGTLTPVIYDISLNQSPITTVTLDTQKPSGSIQINNNNQYTTSARAGSVTLNTSATDAGSGVAYMQFSNNGTNFGTNDSTDGTVLDSVGVCTSPKFWDGTSCWVPFATSYSSWNLTRGAFNGGVGDGGVDGQRTVYVKYRDNAGNVAGNVMVPDSTWLASNNPSLQFNEPFALGSWASANTTCSNLGGRLPTLAEYQSNDFYVVYEDFYWTSEEVNQTIVMLYDGYDGGFSSDVKTTDHYTVCVRDVVNTAIKDDITLDTTAPTVRLDYSPARALKSGDTVRITATFTESMVDSPKTKLAISGVNTLSAADMNKTDATHYYYDYTVGSGNGNATASLSVGTDLAGNVVKSAPTANPTFAVDNTAPTITSVTSTTLNGYYKAGSTINITVNFSEFVISSGNVTLNFDSGGSCSFSVSNANSATCTYTVGAGQNSADLNTSSITGTIADQATNALTNFTPEASLASTKAIVVDSVAPAYSVSYYSDVNLTQPVGNYLKAGTYYLKVAVTEAIGMAAAPTVAIDAEGTANDVSATAATLVSTNLYRLQYNVVSDVAAVGSTAATITTSGADLAGNSATGIDTAKYIDTTLPASSTVITPNTPDGNGGFYINPPSIVINTTEVTSATKYFYWDADAPATYSGSVAMPSADGTHTLHYYAVDAAGNQEGTKDAGPYKLDLHGPTVSNFSISGAVPIAGGRFAVANTHFTLNIVAADTTSGVDTLQISNEAPVYTMTPVTYSSLVGNTYSWDILPQEDSALPQTVTLKILDGAGKETVTSLEVVYDNTAPGAPTIAPKSVNGGSALSGVGQVPNPNWYPYATPYFGLSATDPNALPSGVKGYKYCFSIDQNCTPGSTIVQNVDSPTFANGQNKYYLRVKAVDNVGLESAVTTYNYNYDSSAPASAVYGLSASTTVDGAVVLTWEPITIAATQAPVEKFAIERIKNTVYVGNGLAPNSAWATGNAVTDAANGYASFETTNATTYTDNEANTPPGMAVLQGGVKYIYRIKYKDTSNAAYSPLPATSNLLSIGFTRDRDNPTSPTNVHAYACDGTSNCSTDAMDGTRTHKGHEIKISWNPASDGDGSGIGGYLIYRKHGNSLEEAGWELVGERLLPNSLEWYDNDYNVHQDGTIYHKTTAEKASLLNDYTYYNYRVVAFDNATTEYKDDGTPDRNDSGLFPAGNGEDMFTNLNQEAVRTPDVSAPAMPTGLVERRGGLDASREHQQINVYWNSNFTLTDNDSDGSPTLKIFGYKGTPDLANPLPSQNLFTDWTSQFAHSANDANPNSYMVQGLDDMTYYYFFIEVADRWGNTARSATITPAAKTGNSLAPGPVLSASVDTFHNFSASDLGDKAYLTFNGAYAKGCQPDGTDCVTQYEIYVSETNDETTCPGLEADACWLQRNITNSATQKFTIDQPDNNYNDQRGTQFNYTFAGLDDATDYYVRIRAKSKASDPEIQYGPLYDPTLVFITPDVTAPAVPSGTGLNVKVKDSYPNSTTLRNIVTWQMPEVPTRNKLDNSCTAILDGAGSPVIKNGHEQCNDFAKYKVYRQSVDGAGNPVGQPVEKATITDFNENFYIDQLNIETDIALLDANLKYYVVMMDNADTAFKYPGTNTLVNKPASGPAIANTSEKSWSLNDIIPNHTTPRLASTVTIPAEQLGVSSAVIEWNTDQPSDSLVEYREAGVPDNTAWIAVGSRGNVYHHSVRIFDLKTDTVYDYKVVSRNYLANDLVASSTNYAQKLTEGNLAVSAFPTLRTAKFKIEIPANPDDFIKKTTSTVQVSWTTTKDAKTNYIEYEATHDPNNPQLRGIGGQLATSDGYNLTAHTVVLKGLRPKTNYRYKIKSVSTDNYQAELPEGNGNYYFFETNSFDTSQFTISPSSSNVAERNITSTTAQIVWSTANATTSHVDYGTTTGVYPESAGDDSLNTQHAVVINGLIPGTKYFYKVRGTDDYGNTYTSQEFTFTAILKPKISNLTISDVTPYSIIVKWETNVETETIVNWGKSAAYGEKRGKNELTKNHVLVIDNLEDNTEYHYQIMAHDQSGNEVTDEDKVVRTPLDTVGPKISDMKIDVMPINENDTTGQVIISWKTDKPATTLVQYDEGIIGGRYTKSSTEDTTLSNNHTVIIKGLDPGKNYHFRILAKDKRGNETVSNDYNFITPTQEKSILQLILKSLEETFAWVSRLGSFFSNLGNKAK